jgi:hypothetical protein
MLVGPFGQRKKGEEMKRFAIVILLCVSVILHLSAESPFVVIMYDSKTEKTIGDFPPKRTVWAQTINKVRSLNAKAVVLKFFYDLPKSEDIDLGKSISTIPTFLQACINENDPSNNVLDQKYEMKVDRDYANVISGKNGWIPVSDLAQKAYDVGFVDISNITEIPIIEKYNNRYVRSLYFSVLQYVLPDLKFEKNTLVNNKKQIKLSRYSEMHVNYPGEDKLEYISLCDVLNNKVNSNDIENKVVIIGYDGKSSETFDISTGKVNKHRVFIYGLYDMYNQLK